MAVIQPQYARIGEHTLTAMWTFTEADTCAPVQQRALGESGLSPADPADAAQVIASLHGALARSQAMLVAIQLDDLIGVNIPGTHREYANWRRKLKLPLEAIFNDARWPPLAEIMREAGRSGRSSPA
jgi:4-alpha-glucanotransferase